MIFDPRTPLALLGAMREPCPARDTRICACSDCAPMRVEQWLRRAVCDALRVLPGDVTALVFRTLRTDPAQRWRASVTTRGGGTYVREMAATATEAAERVLSTLTRGAQGMASTIPAPAAPSSSNEMEASR